MIRSHHLKNWRKELDEIFSVGILTENNKDVGQSISIIIENASTRLPQNVTFLGMEVRFSEKVKDSLPLVKLLYDDIYTSQVAQQYCKDMILSQVQGGFNVNVERYQQGQNWSKDKDIKGLLNAIKKDLEKK